MLCVFIRHHLPCVQCVDGLGCGLGAMIKSSSSAGAPQAQSEKVICTAGPKAGPKAEVHVQAVSLWASLPLLQRMEAFLLPYSMYQEQQLQSAVAKQTTHNM